MAVMVGIDPHKRSHTPVTLDGGDTVLGQLVSRRIAGSCIGCWTSLPRGPSGCGR